MAATYNFHWADFMMTLGGNLVLLLIIAFILLSDTGVFSFPAKNVKNMIQEMIPSTGSSESSK